MSENLKKFLEYASQNEQVRQKLDSLEKEANKDTLTTKAIEIAKDASFELTAADFEPDSAAGELSEEELTGVADGKAAVTPLSPVLTSSMHPVTNGRMYR